LYVLGLAWLHTAKSGLFAGIADAASHLASVIEADAQLTSADRKIERG
jgi:hypothetical protein